jgi:hypothetical protein
MNSDRGLSGVPPGTDTDRVADSAFYFPNPKMGERPKEVIYDFEGAAPVFNSNTKTLF